MRGNRPHTKFVKHDWDLIDRLSPLILSGSLIASGFSASRAQQMASRVIRKVPEAGIRDEDFVALVASHLPKTHKTRYLTLEVGKRYLTSRRSRSPLFVFIGGLGGKTLLAAHLAQQLSLERVLAVDGEKSLVRTLNPEKQHLWRASYESASVYARTVKSILPRLLERLGENLHDYQHHRKWCYLWEGIYLSPKALKKLLAAYPTIYFLSVLVLPDFPEIKRRYLVRWLSELGAEKLESQSNLIYSRYLKNIKVMRSRISQETDSLASFVIRALDFEESLQAFYVCLYQRLSEIVEQEVPGWLERIVEDPKLLGEYKKFLQEG